MDEKLIEKALENWQNLPKVRCNFCKKVFKGEHDCDYEYLKKRVQELEDVIKSNQKDYKNMQEFLFKKEQEIKYYREVLGNIVWNYQSVVQGETNTAYGHSYDSFNTARLTLERFE